MPYQYGMQNSPSGGNGLGGLPKKQTTPETQTYTRLIGSAVSDVQGTITPPANAKYMRVAVIGAGGSTTGNITYTIGGGGGGCAASKIVRAAPISYNIMVPAVVVGGGTVATFPGYVLLGGRGFPGGIAGGGGGGGLATGGDYNYLGGNSSDFLRPGGGAGPLGNGGAGNQSGVLSSSGWGVGGGQGGTGSTTRASGTGANSGVNPAFYWGKGDGEMGGGARFIEDSTVLGGVGGIVVEWFYD